MPLFKKEKKTEQIRWSLAQAIPSAYHFSEERKENKWRKRVKPTPEHKKKKRKLLKEKVKNSSLLKQ
jgi:hypothetical protein